MKFLLFFVSILFSFIFYVFHSLSQGRDIFWEKISNSYIFESFSWNLLIESFSFVLIGVIFVYLFSSLKEKWAFKLKSYKTEIMYFLFYIFLIFYIYFYFFTKDLNIYLLVLIILFIVWDVIFNHISGIKQLSPYKIKLRYFWLFTNYVVSYFSIFYIYKYWIAYIPVSILLFSIFFNFLVHKKFKNYISLFNSIIFIWFLSYSLYFFLYKYIDYIINIF